MTLNGLDWFLVICVPALSLAIGIAVGRRSGLNRESYFLSGRQLPWWLLGVSLVATTFSTDTPNLVTDIVRTGGVSKNWLWWSMLPTGMVTAFIYARLWRRSGVLTDLEFYTLRYSGGMASGLRSFRAVYVGVVFNIITLASVSLAAIKIAAVMIGAGPLEVLLVLGLATMVFSAAGGFLGVVLSDLVLFVIAIIGAVAAAVHVLSLPEVGGLSGLLSHPNVAPKLSILPDFRDWETALAVFIIPLTIQWWSVWYPGSEPGGGGYVAQRMLAARNERHAAAAILSFQFAHYALRPWPWIIVALASLIVFPDLDALRQAYPDIPASKVGHDLAYSAMLSGMPHGLLGLMLASLAAAYMSTAATQINWGASYVVNDVWARYVRPGARESELVLVGRLSSAALILVSSLLALALSDALQVFQIMLSVGAGTGLLFLLRWFWWRINAWSELAAMVISFGVSLAMAFLAPPEWSDAFRLCLSVFITTAGWMLVTVLTPPTDRETLFEFVRRIDPAGPGWRRVRKEAAAMGVELPPSRTAYLGRAMLCIPLSVAAIYASLFAIGCAVYGQWLQMAVLTSVALVSSLGIVRFWPHLFDAGPVAEAA